MSSAGFRQTGPRFRPLHLPLVSMESNPSAAAGEMCCFLNGRARAIPWLYPNYLNGISKLLEIERNVWKSYSNLAGCSLPSKYQICCQFFLSAKDLGTFFTPDLQPGTSGFLPCLAEDYTMPVTAAHLVTKCFHLWQ